METKQYLKILLKIDFNVDKMAENLLQNRLSKVPNKNRKTMKDLKIVEEMFQTWRKQCRQNGSKNQWEVKKKTAKRPTWFCLFCLTKNDS